MNAVLTSVLFVDIDHLNYGDRPKGIIRIMMATRYKITFYFVSGKSIDNDFDDELLLRVRSHIEMEEIFYLSFDKKMMLINPKHIEIFIFNEYEKE
jgi:hypothetical protein